MTIPTTRPASRRWVWWTAGPVVFVLLATLGASIGVAAAEREAGVSTSPTTTRQSSPPPRPSTATTTATATASPSPTAAATGPAVRVAAPRTLLGRARSTDNQLKQAASRYYTLAAPAGGSRVTGVYGSNTKRNVIIMLAISGTDTADPAAFLDALAAQAYPQHEFHHVEPGLLGGDARCGDASTDPTPVTLCLWADRGAYGFFYFIYDDALNADNLQALARIQVEHIS